MVGVYYTHVGCGTIRDAKTGLFSRALGMNRKAKSTALHPVERQNLLYPANLLNLKDRDLAERVGFVPDEPAPLNGLGRIGTARNRQIL
jgi:hypothetical protein